MLATYDEALIVLRKHNEFFCIDDEGRPIFQILNKEFIKALTKHLKNRGLVLEVGAGSGLLSKELKEYGVDIVATDDNSWGIKHATEVEQLHYQEAIGKCQPAIILCCWMPRDEDWTPVFRSFECVQDYILIGDKEFCGNESTWENYPGFKRVVLKRASDYAICRMDCIRQDNQQLSRRYPHQVQLFRRLKK